MIKARAQLRPWPALVVVVPVQRVASAGAVEVAAVEVAPVPVAVAELVGRA